MSDKVDSHCISRYVSELESYSRVNIVESCADNLCEALKERRDGESLCLPLQRALRQEGDENLDGGVGRCWQDYNSLQT